MDIFDDGFDIEDATFLGGAIGFAEESIRAEEAVPDKDLEEDIEVDPSHLKDENLRLIYNMNPGLFKYVVNTIRKQTNKWRKDRLDRQEVEEELEALRKTEEILGELGEDDDS